MEMNSDIRLARELNYFFIFLFQQQKLTKSNSLCNFFQDVFATITGLIHR